MIDPIDGTLRFYLEGAGPYAVMIGLAVEREYTAALVALPREELVPRRRSRLRVRASRSAAAAAAARAEATGKRVYVSHDVPEAARERLARAASRCSAPAAVRSPSRRSCPEPAPACASPRNPTRISRSAAASVC